MSTPDTIAPERDRSPEEIEAGIAATRESLDRKLHELEKRLDPRHQWSELRGNVEERLASAPVVAWAALAAVAAGSWMAFTGLRRRGREWEPDGDEPLDTALIVTDIGICDEPM